MSRSLIPSKVCSPTIVRDTRDRSSAYRTSSVSSADALCSSQRSVADGVAGYLPDRWLVTTTATDVTRQVTAVEQASIALDLKEQGQLTKGPKPGSLRAPTPP